MAVATLDGQISFWDVLNAVQTGSIDGRHDLQVGRRAADRITAQKMAGNTYVLLPHGGMFLRVKYSLTVPEQKDLGGGGGVWGGGGRGENILAMASVT